MGWERPAYERLNGYMSFDGLRTLLWCKRCREVHAHQRRRADVRIGAEDGYRVAACNRKGGYAGYVLIEVKRFRTGEDERNWVQQARGL